MQKYKPFLTINLFISPPSSIYNLICPLCRGIFYNPVKDSCGHHFCFPCLYQYKQTNRICPISSSVFENMNNYPDIQLKHLINSQTIICKNFNLGCPWTGLVSEYQQHLESDCDIQRWIYPNEPIFGLKEEINKDKEENENKLAQIASGGEMSRIMLAIKKVLAEVDRMPIMIFDEIDTGISGKAAKSVANKLKTISKNHQVLCISHLAPIAAIADYNYFISKKVQNERTSTEIKLLDEQEVLYEIARISSGEVNEVTLKYASELRNKIA